LTDIYNNGYSILDWAKQVEDMADEDIPYVHSVSYGRDESQETGDEYIQAVNTEFQKLGVRGLSLLFASGDGGTNGREGGWKHFHAGFPASSPYVTAVGGTNFLEKDVIGSETTWSGSGGGFSDHFAIPDYQSKDVAGYLAAANDTYPPTTAYNSSGRGFPDVSALGGGSNQYLIYEYHKPGGAYGTSAATPLVASVFALLNELRLNASKPPMGFLNPFIYQNKQAFNDVTSGINCGSPAFCQHLKGGFPATVGWDPATGVGTPNYAELAKLVS
jgi:tripeptidyl-peptidase-1